MRESLKTAGKRRKGAAVRGMAAFLSLALLSQTIAGISSAAGTPEPETDGYEYRLDITGRERISFMELRAGEKIKLNLSAERSEGDPATPGSLSPAEEYREADRKEERYGEIGTAWTSRASWGNLRTEKKKTASSSRLLREGEEEAGGKMETIEEEEVAEEEDKGEFFLGADKVYGLAEDGSWQEFKPETYEFLLPPDYRGELYVSSDPKAPHESYIPYEEAGNEPVRAFYAVFPGEDGEFSGELAAEICFHPEEEGILPLSGGKELNPEGEIRILSWFQDKTASGKSKENRKGYRRAARLSHREIPFGSLLESEDKEYLQKYLLRAQMVLKLGEGLSAKKQALRLRQLSLPADLLPLSDFLTGITFSDGEGNVQTVFEHGDSFSADLFYLVPRSVLGGEYKGFYYRIPANITIDRLQEGPVKLGEETVGNYSITTEGFLTIRFEENFFLKDEPFDGMVHVDGWIYGDEGGGETEVIFSQTSSVTVRKSTGIRLEKSGEQVSDDSWRFTVFVYPDPKSPDSFQLTDTLSVLNGSCENICAENILVERYHPESGEYTGDAGVKAESRFEDGGHTLFLDNFSRIEGEEHYRISYTMIWENVSATSPSGQVGFMNHIEGDGSTAGYSGDIKKEVIRKYGSARADEQIIDWTVDLDLSGMEPPWSFRDAPEEGAVIGNAVLENSEGEILTEIEPAEDGSLSLDIPEEFLKRTEKGIFRITYQTTAEIQWGAIHNRAEIGPFYAEAEAFVSWGEEDVFSKTGAGTEFLSDETVLTIWNIEFKDPDNTDPAITFTEGPVVDGSSTLKEGLYFPEDCDEKIRESMRVFSGEEEITSGSKTEISRTGEGACTIRVSSGDAQKPVTEVSFKVYMLVDITGEDLPMTVDNAVSDGREMIFGRQVIPARNRVRKYIARQEDPEARWLKSREYSLESFGEGNISVPFRMEIAADGTRGDLSVQDTLPEGMRVFPDEITVLKAGAELPDSQYLTDYDEESNILTVSFPDEGTARSDDYSIIYEAYLRREGVWFGGTEGLTEEKTEYRNRAKAGDSEDYAEAVFVTGTPFLEKEAKQKPDTNTLDYCVRINPEGKDAVPGGEELRLSDRLVPESGVDFRLLPESVKLYRTDAEGNAAEEMPADAWRFVPGDRAGELELTVPDSTPLVLCYSYSFVAPEDRDCRIFNVIEAKNTLSGKENSAVENVLSYSRSYAFVNRRSMRVVKTSSEDYSERLDCLFRLSRLENFSFWKEVREFPSGTTFYPAGYGEEFELEPGVFYRIEEIEAPSGYRRSDRAQVFLWMTDETPTDSYQGGLPPDYFREEIDFIPFSGGDSIFMDEPYELTVRKTWRDPEGNPLSEKKIPADYIEADLHRIEVPVSTCRIKVTLQSGDIFEYTVRKGSLLTIRDCWGDVYVNKEKAEGETENWATVYRIALEEDSLIEIMAWQLPHLEFEEEEEDDTLAAAIAEKENDTVIEERFFLTRKEGWEKRFAALPARSADGKKDYLYYVVEKGGEDYEVTAEGNYTSPDDKEIELVNTMKPPAPGFVLPKAGSAGLLRLRAASAVLFGSTLWLFGGRKKHLPR